MRALAAWLAFVALGLAACGPAETASAPDAPAASGQDGAAALDAEGFGPIRVGMTLAEASAALGEPLAPRGVSEEAEACNIVRPADSGPHAGLQVMLLNQRVDRVSIYAPEGDEPAPAQRTDRGIGLGATDEAVRAAYPEAVEQPAKYNDAPAHDLLYWARPNERGVRFEIGSDGKVWAIHAGGPSIQYVEGCA